MTADIATLGIRIDARQVRDADQALDNFSRSGERAERSANTLNGAMERMQRLALQVSAALGAAEVVKLADAWANLQGQLSLVVDGQQRLAQTTDVLYQMAQRTRQGLKETVDLYARISRSTESLNKTDAERLRVTDTINKALVVSHSSTQASAAALMQLGQAFGANRLGGEELNSVLEQTPRLAQAIAEGMGKNVGDLKTMAAAGKLTAEAVFNALQRSAGAVDAEFAKLPTTVGQATTQIENALLRTVGMFDQSNQLSHGLASTLSTVAQNMGLVVGAAATLGAVKLVNWLADVNAGVRANIAANFEQRAALVAMYETEAAAAVASAGLANATAIQARAHIGAAVSIEAEVAANAELVVAEIAATTAANAQTVAMERLTIAQRMYSTAAAAGRGIVGALGGPLGVLVTVLGLAATAWSWYQSKEDEANAAAAANTSKSTETIIGDLDKQIAKMERRNELAKQAGGKAVVQQGGESADRAGEMLEHINTLKAKGVALDGASQVELITLQGDYDRLIARAQKLANVTANVTATSNDEKFKEWTQKHTEVLDKKGKILAAVADAEKELGAAFAPNKDRVTKLITDSINKQDVTKEVDAYQTLIASIREKTAENLIEAKVGRDATEAQKLQIKFDEDVRTGKLKLSAAHKATAQAALEELAASEKAAKTADAVRELAKSHAELVVTEKEWADGLQVSLAGYGKISDARDLDMIGVKNQADMQRKLNEWTDKGVTVTDGMRATLAADTEERTRNERAIQSQQRALQYADQLRQQNRQFTIDYTLDPKVKAAAQLAVDNDLWQQRINLAEKGTEARARIESEYTQWLSNQQIKPQLDAQISMWNSIEQVARDTFMSIQNGGAGMATRLRDTLKNTLFAWLYEMTLKKWIVQIEGQYVGTAPSTGGLNGGMGDMFQSAASNSSNSAVKAVGQAQSIYSAIDKGFDAYDKGAGSTLGSGVTSVGDYFGSESVSSFGKGMQGFGQDGSLGASAGYGQAASSAASFAGAYAAGVAIGRGLGNKISGDYGVTKNNRAFVNWSTMLSPWAIGGGVGGGLINRAFGRKAPEIESQGLRGSFDGTGVTGQTYQNIVEKGGWFSSTRRHSDTQDLDASTMSQLTQAFLAVEDTSSSFAKSLGLGNDALAGYTKAFDIAFTSDADKNQKAIEDYFKGVSDEVANKLVPNLASFSQTGETAAATLERLAAEFDATKTAAQNLGTNVTSLFGTADLSGAASRERLVQLAGGTSQLESLTSAFAKNFLSGAERLAPVSDALDAAFKSLGLATIPQTTAQYKALVQSIKPTNEESAKLLVNVLELGDAFAQVHADSSIKARELEIAVMRAQGNEAGAVAAERQDELAAMDASLRPLQARVWALQDEGAAIDAAYAAVEKAVSAEKTLRQKQHDAETKAVQTAIDAANTALRDTKDLAQNLHSTLDKLADTVSTPADLARQRAAALAQLQGAAAINRAGGPLPKSADIAGALSTLEKDGKDLYSDAISYKRDQYLAAIAVSDLAESADTQVDATQAQLDALNRLKDSIDAAYAADVERLDEQLAAARDAVDIAKGTYTATLSTVDAINNLGALISPSFAIMEAYQTSLGRAPDAAGAAYYQQQINAGASVGDITNSIGNSDEAKINALYGSVLGRNSDKAGMDYWLTQLHNGTSLDTIKSQMKGSSEYLNKPASMASTSATASTSSAGGMMTDAEVKAALLKIASNTMRTANATEDTNRTALENQA